jgi:hypothetical protein
VGRIIKTLFVLSLLLIVVVAQEEGYDWGNSDWTSQQDFNSYNVQDLIAGVEQNPNLLNDPKFFTAFETKLTTDVSALDNKPEVLAELGKKIGVDFSEGSGISSYTRGAEGLTVSTKGCDDCDPSYLISIFPEKLKAQGSEVVVNSDGSVDIKPKGKKGFSAHGGIISTQGDDITIESGTIVDGDREFTTTPGFAATTSGDGTYTLNSVIFTGTDGEKVWLGGEEDFQLDLRDLEKPKVSLLGTKEILVGKISNPAETLTLKSGSAVLESSSKYLFSKDSQFTVTRGKSESTFSADNNLRFCFGECYGTNGFLPSNYESQGASTIELLEDYELNSQQRTRNILKITSVDGDDLDVDLLNPAYSFVYTSVFSTTSGIGHVNVVQRGVYGLDEPFYSKTKMDNIGATVVYGQNPETGEAYFLGGSPIMVNHLSGDEKNNVVQDVQLVFLSNEAYDSEKPVYGSGEIDLLTLFIEDQDLIETDFVDVGRLTGNRPTPEVSNMNADDQKLYERQMRAIDRAKELLAQGKTEEAQELIYEEILDSDGDSVEKTWTDSERERRKKVLEYAMASGLSEQLDIGKGDFVRDIEDAYFSHSSDEKDSSNPVYELSDEDAYDLNIFSADKSEYGQREFVIRIMDHMLFSTDSMSQQEYYDKKVAPLNFLTDEQKALFHPDNREQTYHHYDALLYDHYCNNPVNPTYCDSRPKNMYTHAFNHFAEQWE